jgi:lipopolysaccharide heptosyltransferase I
VTKGPPRRPRVLIVRLSAVGDVLHALPAAAALRRALPEATIDWVVEDRAAALLEGHPLLDRVLVFPRRRWRAALARPWRWPGLLADVVAFVARLLARRYDAALDLQGNLKSGVVALLSGAPRRVGFASDGAREGNGLFVNQRVAPRGARHRVERNLAAASALVGVPLAHAPFPIVVPAAEAARADAALRGRGLERGRYAVLHPGTSGFGAFKRWPAERFARLADRLGEDAGLAVALTFGPGEEPLAEAVRAAARGDVVPVPTESLLALAHVIRGARVFVSADTGPLHVAAAVGTPVLGLFGPKDAAVYGPYGVPPSGGPAGPLPVLVRDDVPCRPCPLRWCPDPVCMTGIGADAAYAALRLTP